MGARRTAVRLSGVAVLLLLAAACASGAPASPSLVNGSPAATKRAAMPKTYTLPTVAPAQAAAANTPKPGLDPRIEWTKGPKIDGMPNIAGWSGGYFAFKQMSPDDYGVMVSSSADGVTWADGPRLPAGEPFARISVAEGPAGLLILGWQQGCGEPEQLHAMWLSADGRNWTGNMVGAFAGATVLTVAGGSSGYVATGYTGDPEHANPIAWTSKDARDWQQSTPAGSADEEVAIYGGVSFPGGFVLAGATWPDAESNCTRPSTVSVWWSADGSDWTRYVLPGGSPATNPQVQVYAISGRVLVMASVPAGDPEHWTNLAWVSSDGRTWTSIALPFATCDLSCAYGLGTFDDQGLMLTRTTVDEPDGNELFPATGGFAISGTSVVQLRAAGDIPVNVWATARGPKGVLVIGLEGQSWLGVPIED